MRCEDCANVSDWVGGEADWSRVTDAQTGHRPLVECDVCGNRQHVR